VQYGLIRRPKEAAGAAPTAEPSENGTTTRDWELVKFKSDMERLPEVYLHHLRDLLRTC
jgi:hypothetical protein